MTKIISFVRKDTKSMNAQYAVYLATAAKIVETVAFEIAQQREAKKTEELLALACAIEKAADDIAPQD